MNQQYFVVCGGGRAGIEVYPDGRGLGEFMEKLTGTKANPDFFQKIHHQFTDPSLTVVCLKAEKRATWSATAITKTNLRLYGSFIVIGSTIDYEDPECLTWGQAVAAIRELRFSTKISVSSTVVSSENQNVN